MKTLPIQLKFIATEADTVELAAILSRQASVPRFQLARRRPAPPEIDVEIEVSPIEAALLRQVA